jgi:hypothetical protein
MIYVRHRFLSPFHCDALPAGCQECSAVRRSVPGVVFAKKGLCGRRACGSVRVQGRPAFDVHSLIVLVREVSKIWRPVSEPIVFGTICGGLIRAGSLLSTSAKAG